MSERKVKAWLYVSGQAWCTVKSDEEWLRGFEIVPKHFNVQVNSIIHLDCRSCGFTFRHVENLSFE
jgi:hypothetical protein